MCEGGGQIAVGLGLCEQRVGLSLERLDCIGAGSKPGRRILEPDERYESLGELGGVAALFPIHTFPSGDDLLGPFGIAVNTRLSVDGRVVIE